MSLNRRSTSQPPRGNGRYGMPATSSTAVSASMAMSPARSWRFPRGAASCPRSGCGCGSIDAGRAMWSSVQAGAGVRVAVASVRQAAAGVLYIDDQPLRLKHPVARSGTAAIQGDVMKRALLSLSFVGSCRRAGGWRKASVADFYKGKTVRIVVGVSVGSGYDVTARVLAAPFRQAHSRQSDRDRAEPARRRQHHHGQPALRQRPVRRHRDGRAVQRPADDAAAAADRRALRSEQAVVDRLDQPRDAGHLYVAHRAGEGVHRHRQDRGGHRRAGARHDPVRLSDARQRRCSNTSSRSSPATRARRTFTSRWSAARSTATARPIRPRCWRSTATGSRRRRST